MYSRADYNDQHELYSYARWKSHVHLPCEGGEQIGFDLSFCGNEPALYARHHGT